MKPRNRKAGPGKKKDGTQKWKHMGTGNAKHGSRKLESKVTEVKKKLGLGSQKTRAQKKDEEGPRSEAYATPEVKKMRLGGENSGPEVRNSNRKWETWELALRNKGTSGME
jgi:hypothetical protein